MFFVIINFFIKKIHINYKLIVNKIIKILIYIFYIIIIFLLILRILILKLYYIKSESMYPTLLIGDIVLIKKIIYNINNYLNKINLFYILQPKINDIILFKYPMNIKFIYIKRIVGTPYEIIQYILNKNNIIIHIRYNINNIIYIKKIIMNLKYKNNFFIKNINIYNIIYKNLFFKIQFNKKFNNLCLYNKKIINNINTLIIPKNKYFVIGDNINNSFDSRYWNFISKKYFVGKVILKLNNFIKKFIKNFN